MLPIIRSPLAWALAAAGLVTLASGALADPYGYGAPYGGQGAPRPGYGSGPNPQGTPQRSYGNAGYRGADGGGYRAPSHNGASWPAPQNRPQATNPGPAPQAYPGPRSYYPSGTNPNRAPAYAGPATAPAPASQPNPAPTPAPAAASKPVYVYVVFQQSATAVETASFLRTYNLAVDDGPSNDGFFQLRVSETLPESQLKAMIDSMRMQTKVVSRVES